MAPLWWAALAAGLVYLGVVASGRRGPVRAVKVLPALLLAGWLGPTHPIAAGGMLVSAAGDAFLLDKDRFFLAGLGAFLVAHLLFVPAFLGASGATPSGAFVASLLVFAGGMLAVIRPKKPVLQVAVPLYALVLCAMAAAASTLGPLGWLGGLSFLVSDGVLSIRVFRREFPGADLIVMVTYYGALLALSLALAAPP
ncbi:MAG: lysoplasmalogenase [Myxococcota bacterium]